MMDKIHMYWQITKHSARGAIFCGIFLFLFVEYYYCGQVGFGANGQLNAPVRRFRKRNVLPLAAAAQNLRFGKNSARNTARSEYINLQLQ